MLALFLPFFLFFHFPSFFLSSLHFVFIFHSQRRDFVWGIEKNLLNISGELVTFKIPTPGVEELYANIKISFLQTF
jgi:hypothetical protein